MDMHEQFCGMNEFSTIPEKIDALNRVFMQKIDYTTELHSLLNEE
jgi:hypothetical protein